MDLQKTKRKSVMLFGLDDYDMTAGPNDWIEVCEWTNGDGLDIMIGRGDTERSISMSYEELKVINMLKMELDTWK